MATDFYKQNGSYFTTGGQKVANPTELQSLAKAGGREIAMPTVPQGATKISSPDQLTGLTESQIFRQGQDIYKLPPIDSTMLDTTQNLPDIPPVDNTTDVSPYLAGLEAGNEGLRNILEQINKPEPQQAQISETSKRISELSEKQAQVEESEAQRLKDSGYYKYSDKAESLLDEIDIRSAEYDSAIMGQEGRRGLAGSIYGRQAAIQRQKAVDITRLSAMADSYMGKANSAMAKVEKMIEMELAPIQTRIDNQKFQLDLVKDQLTDEQAKKASSLELILDERQRQLDEEKEKRNNIADVMITAAQNGADQKTLDKIMNSNDYLNAIRLAGQYYTSGDWEESDITDANGNPLLFNSTTGEYKTSVGTSTSDIFFTDANGDSWNIAGWATDQTKPQQMNAIAKQIGKVTEENINEKVKEFTPGLTADMIKEASAQSGVSWEAIMTMVVQEALGGTSNVAKNNNNFGGLTWSADTQWQQEPYNGYKGTARPEGGNYIKFPTKQQGLNAMADLMAQYGKVSPNITSDIMFSETALSWVEQIRNGDAKIDNIQDEKLRNEVVNALSLTENPQDTEADIIAKEKANIAINLIDDKGLSNAVGAIALGRKAPFQWGQKVDFINKTEQLISDLSLQNLIDAKSRGATFGALSDSELKILSSAATTIGNMRVLDDNGNVIGYSSTESAFKNELRKIQQLYLKALKNKTIDDYGSDDPLGLGVTANSTNPLGI